MPDDAFARALRERRRALDLTQAAFASRVGCATITLKRIETGTLRPSRELAERIVRLLELPAAERDELVWRARRAPAAHEPANPYKGLRAFDEADAPDFFGREATLAALLERLASPAPRFLAVVGPSGSGKSSLARAGLVPAVRRGALPGIGQRVAMITPGVRPLDALDAAVKRLAPGGLLLVDQIEELWALCPHEAERAAFLRRLVELARGDGPLVVATLRADFYDRPLHHHAFGTLLRERTEVLLPLTPDEIARAVAAPAERAGVGVDAALVAACVADAERRAGALPLLQYALTELWDRRADGRLALDAYRAVGGVGGALTSRADALYDALDGDDQDVARQVFLRLVQPGEAGDATRRRARVAELPGGEDAGLVVELFARHRLLTLDREAAGATVELAHEALIDGWGRLRAWVEEFRDDLRTHRRLTQAAAEWRAAGRDASFLAAGARLAQFEALERVELNAEERAYLARSVAERERAAADERARQEALREALAQSEARRLAAEALKLLREGGSAELITLLALRSLDLRYTPQGDEALCGAARLALPVQHFAGHTGRIYCVAYAADGATAITAGQDFTIRQWDVGGGAELRRFVGHTGNIRGLAFSPDGRLIASGSDDQTARIWDVTSGATICTLPHRGEIRGMAFALDGRRLLTWSLEPLVRQWDVATGQLLDTHVAPDLVLAAALSPDGHHIVACLIRGRTVRWRGASDTPEQLPAEGGDVAAVSFSPDGALLLTAHPVERVARLWDAGDGRLLRVFQGHADIVQYASFTPDGAAVVTSSNDSSVRLWDGSSGAEIQRFTGHNNLIWQHAVSPDGRFLLTGGTDGIASLWALDHRPCPPLLRGHTLGVMVAAYTSDGRLAVTVGEDRALCVWDAASGEKVHRWHVLPDITLHGGMACVPGMHAVALACNDGVGRIVDLNTGVVRQSLMGHTRRIWGTAVSPDGRTVLTTSSDRTARLWDVASGVTLRVLTGHTDLVVGAAFSPDGRLLATGSDDGTVRLWDVASGVEVQRLVDPRFPMVYAAVTPDGQHVLTGSADGTVRLWDCASAGEVWRASGHHGYINSVQIAPSGRLALTAGQDRVARLWDVAAGAALRSFAGHTGGVYAAGFSPDERFVITGSGDGTARIWHLDWCDTASALRERLLRGFNPIERAQYGIAE